MGEVHSYSQLKVTHTYVFSSGGFILEKAIRDFSQMALFQPVINGIF